MLYLSRTQGEYVNIYHPNTNKIMGRVWVSHIGNGKVKLGFDMFDGSRIARSEVDFTESNKKDQSLSKEITLKLHSKDG